MKTALVSIVIPTYNRAQDLKRALQSVRAQTYAHWECLVVDNHSTDNSDEIIQAFNDPKIICFKIHNQGIIAASRNLGIQHAQGRYIAFLDSDDWWNPEKLQRSVDYLEQGMDFVYHDLYLVNKLNQRLFIKRTRTHQVKSPVYDELLKKGNPVLNSSVVVRAELIKQINGFSEEPQLVAAEDFEGWCRIAQLTDRFQFIPSCLGYYWCGGGNTSNAKRSLSYLTHFYDLHLEAYHRAHALPPPFWWQYALGRALYLTGNYSGSLEMLSRIRKQKLSIMIKLKIAYMTIMSQFYHRSTRYNHD